MAKGLRQRGRGDRLSRHWHDVVRLDDAGIVDKALPDHALALAVARHKALFFREKDADGAWVDYEAAVSGELRLVPTGAAFDALVVGRVEIVPRTDPPRRRPISANSAYDPYDCLADEAHMVGTVLWVLGRV